MNIFASIKPRILIIDEKDEIALILRDNENYVIETISPSIVAEKTYQTFDLIIMRINHLYMNLLKKISQYTSVVAICEPHSFEQAIQAIHFGAYTCLATPIDQAHLLSIIAHIVNQPNKNMWQYCNTSLVSKSHIMQETIKDIKKLKQAHTVSFVGSCGCGKKFIAAHFMHLWQKQFFIINCHGYDAPKTMNMLENMVKQNSERTFIINHPEQFSPHMQNKLLNIMHATLGNNLNQWIHIIDEEDENNLIPPLHERIFIFKIRIPTLAERLEDVHEIAKLEQKTMASALNKKARKLDLSNIIGQQWPGNFKQLAMYLEQTFYINNDIDYQAQAILLDEIFMGMSLKDAITLFEITYLKKQIANNKGILKNAAKAAKINRTTLYRKLKLDA